jgi:Replication protein.
LKLDDIENGDLIHVDEETGEISEGTKIIAAWDWQRKNYFVK